MPAIAPILIAATKLALEDLFWHAVSPPPLANGELPIYDDLETDYGTKETEPLESEPRVVLKVSNQNQQIFYNPTRDSFDQTRRRIPRPPSPLSVTDTKNSYSEEIVQGLQTRSYGSLLYKVLPNQEYKHRTFFPTKEKIVDFYKTLFDKSAEFLAERLNSYGEFVTSATKSALNFISFPASPETFFLVGTDLLMKYKDFLFDRLKEIDNFPILPFIVSRFFDHPEPTAQPTPEEKIPKEDKDYTNRFISSQKKIEDIYRWLGIEDFKPPIDKNNKPIERKNGDYDKEYFPAEAILNNTILRQFNHEDLENRKPDNFNPEEVMYQIKNLPELIASLLSVFQFRLGCFQYPVPLPESFTSEEDYPDTFEGEKARIEQELTTLPPFDIPTKKQLAEREQQYQARKAKDLFAFDVGSVADHLSRIMLQIDEITGQYPIKLKIEENDLIKTDGEDVEITIPNMAEGMKELIRLNIEEKAISEADLNASVRSLIEVGNNKVITYRNYYLLDLIVEAFGFGTKEVKKKLPMLHDILALKKNTDDDSTNDEPLSALLQDSTLEVTVDELNDKRDFQQDFDRILRAAAVTMGVHMVQFGKEFSETFFSDQIKKWKGEMDKEKNSFEDFIKEFEDGFAGKSNVEDPTKPFGKDKDRRPQIKIVTKKTAENKDNGS